MMAVMEGLSSTAMGTTVLPLSGPALAPRPRCCCGLLGCRNLRFPDTGWVADTAEEAPVCAAALDKPAIFAFRTSLIAGTAAASDLGRSIRSAGQSRSAGLAYRHQISAVLDMLAPKPDATVLSHDAQQPPATFPADMSFGLRTRRRDNAVGGVFLQLGNKRRRPRVRGEDR